MPSDMPVGSAEVISPYINNEYESEAPHDSTCKEGPQIRKLTKSEKLTNEVFATVHEASMT